MDSTDPTSTSIDATYRPWLRRFCLLTIAATFTLIAIGGKVTSYDVGMAVPDGFTTFGHITFLAPLSDWWHDFGTRWEHSHRLQGNLVGIMTIVMAVWLWLTQRDRTWLRWAGVVMLLLVISQGVMGALRVEEVSITLAFIHGIVGQLILCSWIVVSAALSKPWLTRLTTLKHRTRTAPLPKLRWAVRLLLVALLVQLTLGAAVRHFKADKSPPDLLVYGQVVPPMSQDALDQAYTGYYAGRMGVSPQDSGVTNRNPFGDVVVSVGDVYLQLAHRFGALIVTVLVVGVIIGAYRNAGDRSAVVAPSLVLLMLLGTQVALGVMTVLSETDPILATLHQATGAALIATATWLAVRIHLVQYAQSPAVTDNILMQAAQTRPAAAPAPVPA